MGKRIKDLTTYSRKLASGDAWMVLDNGTTVNKVNYPTLAGELVGEYAGTSLAGKSQSVKAALDTMNTDIETLKTRVSDTESATTWTAVANALRIGQKPYAIGDTFSEPWTDIATGTTYDNPWRVNHYETCLTENNVQVPGMWLQNVYAVADPVQFSHNRAFLRCPDGLSAGTYYVVMDDKWGNVPANSAWSFTLTKDVESGGRLAGFYNLPVATTSSFKVYSYKSDGKTLIETVDVESGEAGTLLGNMKSGTRSANLNSMQEAAYGWNNYEHSAIRQYLNSDAGVGEWWTAQDGWDIAPNELSQKAGYLSGFPRGFVDSLVPVKVITYVNNVYDGGAAVTLYDKVNLISLSQMYVASTLDEGNAHDYYVQLNGTAEKYKTGTSNVYPELLVEDIGTKNAVGSRLRTANRGLATSVHHTANGSITNYYCSISLKFQPLVFIG